MAWLYSLYLFYQPVLIVFMIPPAVIFWSYEWTADDNISKSDIVPFFFFCWKSLKYKNYIAGFLCL